METAYSVNNVPIRLTEERWEHIVDNKPYMYAFEEAIFQAIEEPTLILAGYAGARVAVLSLGRERFLHVVYKEVSSYDGFVVTAFVSRTYNRGKVIWPSRS